jgi:hypothetical protein
MASAGECILLGGLLAKVPVKQGPTHIKPQSTKPRMPDGDHIFVGTPAVNHRQTLRAVLLICIWPLLFLVGVFAQTSPSSSLQLSTFKTKVPAESFRGEFLWLVGAGLSPDGKQVAVAYFTRATPSPDAKFVLNLRIWKVGTQEPIAIKQISSEEAEPDLPLRNLSRHPEGFVQYCDHGSGIMVSDPHGTLYYLNPQTLEVLHATATNVPIRESATPVNPTSERVFCAAESPRAVFAVYGGAFGNGPYRNGLVRVYALTSGTLIHEWNMRKHPYPFGDAAISRSGNQIAVSRVPENSAGRAKDVQNLELFDVGSAELTLQVKTGHLPGRIVFAGENRIATDDTVVPQPFFPHPKIKLWDASNGKLIGEFSDPQVGARRFVGASRDGSVILGFPKEVLRTERFSGFWNETLEQRFRLWDAATGKTIATSPLIFPNLNSTKDRNEEVDPSLELSGNGQAVLVFWKPQQNEILPIYVFSELPAETVPTTH